MPQTISGQVDSNGSVIGGKGFTVTKVETGKYNIAFSNPFTTAPAVVATITQDGAWTTDVAVVWQAATGHALLITEVELAIAGGVVKAAR
ncbi:hypothetical protein [Streptomyces millisiae]|uniref:Uncharacterized protein n=1 Tax=Streptomyces millisiae TaxID=3075542 RepID=A0ABU2LW96_9ACTN|nr:hypothetical protein [Streptomyces sp. DSM 44918]MDT0321857.1 hypothetical protein [Streptomyces sp. DSM 44918]